MSSEEISAGARLREPLAVLNEILQSDAEGEACDFVLGKSVFADRTNPVTAVAAMAAGDGFELAVKDAAP